MKKPLVLFACLSLSATLTGCSFLGQSKSSPLSHNGNHSASSIASFDDTFSTTSIEIDPDEPYLYDIGSVNTLNGLFRLDASTPLST